MKILKSILPALMVSSSLILLSPPVSAAPKQKPAAGQADRMRIADEVGQNDLYGFWGNAAENEKGSLINTTTMHPDGTGVDTMILTVKAEGSPLSSNSNSLGHSTKSGRCCGRPLPIIGL